MYYVTVNKHFFILLSCCYFIENGLTEQLNQIPQALRPLTICEGEDVWHNRYGGGEL